MSESKPQSAARAVSLIVIITLASQPIGLLREIIIAAEFGTGVQMDAYNMAYSIILIIPVLITSYVASTYVPEYTLARLEGEHEASRFYSMVMTAGVALSVIIAIAGWMFAPQLISLFAPGFEGEARDWSIRVLKLVVWFVPMQVAMQVLDSTLNARKLHIIPTLAGASINLFVIPATLFLTKHFGIWAYVGAVALNLIFQLTIKYSAVSKHGQRYRPYIGFQEPRLLKTLKLALPTVAASAVGQINQLVDKTISSGLPLGSVSSYGYALQLYNFVPGIVFAPFMTVMFTRMSERAAKKDRPGSLDIMWRTIEVLLAVALPICAVTMFMRNEVVRIVFERGAFGEESTRIVGLVLMFYIWFMALSAVFTPINHTLIAWQDMRGMIPRAFIGVSINVSTSIILSRYLGIIGVVLGTLLSAFIGTLLLIAALRRRWGPLGILRTFIEGIKMSGCTVVCGLSARLLRGLLPASKGTVVMDVFRFGTVTVISCGIFYGLALLFRVRSVKEVYSLLTAKIRSIIKRKAKQK